MIAHGRIVWASVFLPVVVICALIARAGVRVHQGIEIELPVRGYDPRDLLLGHYITYAYDWDVLAQCESGDCVYCIGEIPTPGERVIVRRIETAQSEECRDRILDKKESLPTRYYIPEHEGATLERAIREHRASVKLSIDSGGHAVVRELLLDGKPWRQIAR